MKHFLIIFIFLFVFPLLPRISYAKTLPQAKTASRPTMQKSAPTSSINVSARFRRDRKALLVYFSNVQNAKSVSYALIYTTNGREEGASGSVRSNEGNSVSRELLFGTCSKNVCTYHNGITNMRLEITGELKNGKTFTKRYKIKI